MSKVIAELWNGNLEPIYDFGIDNQEMKDIEELMQRCIEKLEKMLNDEQKLTFQRYCEHVNEYLSISSEQAFCDGYCLGTKIAVEALTGADKMLGCS